MYVRGKYGKSLKLDKLKETTRAAKDTLNTIGNSRSTPKEKLEKQKSKHGSGSSCGSNKSLSGSKPNGNSGKLDLENFMAIFPPLGATENRVKDVMQQLQSRQALLDHSERFKEIYSDMGPEQAKLLMPFFAGNGSPTVNPPRPSSPMDDSSEKSPSTPQNKENNMDTTEVDSSPPSSQNENKQLKAADSNTAMTPPQDDNKNELKPLEVSNHGSEISAQ